MILCVFEASGDDKCFGKKKEEESRSQQMFDFCLTNINVL